MKKHEALKLKEGDKVILKKNADEIYAGLYNHNKEELGKEIVVEDVNTDGSIITELSNNYPHECFTFPNKKPENVEAGDVIENEDGDYRCMILFASEYFVAMSSWEYTIKEANETCHSSSYSMTEFIKTWNRDGWSYTDQEDKDLEVFDKDGDKLGTLDGDKLIKRNEYEKPSTKT